jgi:hypothetical protein
MDSKSVWNAILALPALAVLAAAGVAPPARAADPAASADYRQGPVSSWVEVDTPAYDAPAPAGDVVDSAYILLYDRQINVRARGHEYYQHLVTRVINESGAESRSQLTVYVDPGYQRLTLHWLRVYRDGRLRDRLAQSRVTVLPVESELQNRIYSGEQSINLLIPDLRAGDVLDYAYTLDSVSPSFPGHFAESLGFVWSEPVHHQRIRVRHESGNPVRYRVHGGEAEPVVRERGGHRELRFEWRELTARQDESDVPDSHVFWPYVEFSNMSDWSELARIAADMYRRESVTGPLTQARIASLKTMVGSVEDRVLTALRMVQDEVRYASISIGPGSFRPSRPDVVLERNFGDCKDKSLLVASLLRSIGVDAKLALVHSTRGRALPDALPTPYAFDHAIVRLNLDGACCGLTRCLQRGSLAETARPTVALVIDPATTGLEAMPRPAGCANGRSSCCSTERRSRQMHAPRDQPLRRARGRLVAPRSDDA